MHEYSPSLNRASTDLGALLPTLVETYRVQQQNCLDTMIRCTTEYGVHRRIVAAATVVGGVILVGSRHYSPIMRAQADTSVHEKAEGRFEGFIDQYDQILEVEKDLRNRTCSSRNVVSAWNVGDLPFMNLHPCHFAWQLVVSAATAEDKELSGTDHDLTLSLVLYQRSADHAVGVPFNLGCYSLILNMFAKVHKYNVGSLTANFGDCHVYTDQIPLIKQQVKQWKAELSRPNWIPPKFEIDVEGITSIVELAEQPERVKLVEYSTTQPNVPYPVAV